MSPNQKRERRLEVEEAAVKKIIERAWILFRHDEALRCTTRVELVSALRKLKSRLLLQIKAAKHTDWITYTAAFIDEKIAALVSDQPLRSRKTAIANPTAPGQTAAPEFWLSKLWQKRPPKPPTTTPEDPEAFAT